MSNKVGVEHQPVMVNVGKYTIVPWILWEWLLFSDLQRLGDQVWSRIESPDTQVAPPKHGRAAPRPRR